MTTASKPLPPHGSQARYKGTVNRPACHCDRCVAGWTRAGQKRLLARLEGRPASVPAAPVTEHITLLLASDMTTCQIAAAAGVSVSTITVHARGAFPRIHRATAEKILAVRPRQYVGVGYVPALGSTRRCRALYAIGHGPAAIAASVPELELRSVEYIVRGARKAVSVTNHFAVIQAYRALSGTAGTSAKALSRAERHDWAGPDYWDEDDFDNPDFTPATGPTPRYVVLSENGLELERQGHTREQAAERLGVTRDGLQRALQIYRSAYKEAA
jgi:hypothetical protein